MKQLEKLDVVKKAIAGFITVKDPAEKLGLSERQVQRLKRKVGEADVAVLVHKNSLQKPSHTIPEEIRKKILAIRKEAGYEASNFPHFQEPLEVMHSIKISYSALYRLLVTEGIKSPMTRRRFKAHRRRKRRSEARSFVQMDASPYDWLIIGTMLELHGAIDDATSHKSQVCTCAGMSACWATTK